MYVLCAAKAHTWSFFHHDHEALMRCHFPFHCSRLETLWSKAQITLRIRLMTQRFTFQALILVKTWPTFHFICLQNFQLISPSLLGYSPIFIASATFCQLVVLWNTKETLEKCYRVAWILSKLERLHDQSAHLFSSLHHYLDLRNS